MTNCRETTRLLSDAADRELTRDEELAVQRHFRICPACRRCARQFALLHDGMQGLKTTRLDT